MRVRAAKRPLAEDMVAAESRLYHVTTPPAGHRPATSPYTGEEGRLWRVHSAGTLRQFGLFASGGALFTAEKCRKRAGGCGPRTPVGLRGVHPKERHRTGRYAPPSCPVPYRLPLFGSARASEIG